MRGLTWWLVAVLVGTAPLTGATPAGTIELQAQLERLEIDSPASVAMSDALLQLEPGMDRDAPAVQWDGGIVRATQYWLNSTSVLDPFTGKVVHRYNHQPASRDLDLAPTALHLLEPTDAPDLRIAFTSVLGVTSQAPQGLEVNAGVAMDALGPARPYLATRFGILEAWDRPPEQSGWITFPALALDSPGSIDYLVDGWSVRLVGGETTADLQLGTVRRQTHHVEAGGHVEDTYSFLVVRTEAASHRFDEASRLSGYAPAPRLAWDGPAKVRLYRGDLAADGAKVPLTRGDVAIQGRFQAEVHFGPESTFAGAPFRATGVGTSSVVVQGAPLTGAIGAAGEIGLWASVAIGAAAVALLGTHTYRAPRQARKATVVPTPAVVATPDPPAVPQKPDLGTLIENAQKSPLDPDLQYALGIELFRAGRPDVGIRALDRAFRLAPGGIVKLLEDPELGAVRAMEEVRQLLGRFQREQHRKVWAGYA